MTPYYLYRRFMKVLDEDPIDIVFKKLPKDTCGFLDGNRIEIDHRKDDILRIFIHELLHIIYPDAYEKVILKYERYYMSNASLFQKKKLMQILCLEDEK